MIRRISTVLYDNRPAVIQFIRKTTESLQKRGVQVLSQAEQSAGQRPELILSFGGDGTLLAGMQDAIRYDVPLFGFNLGTLGFLTEGETENLEVTLERLLSEDFTLDSRSLLQLQVPAKGIKAVALNDAALTRGGFSRLIQVKVTVNGECLGSFMADGIVVATPTGSTGYSLSAGGPIVSPEVSCLVITPVCAHSLQHCPFIVPASAQIQLQMQPEREHSAGLQVDGRSVATLRGGDQAELTGARETLKLVRLKPLDFFGRARKKLTEWGTDQG